MRLRMMCSPLLELVALQSQLRFLLGWWSFQNISTLVGQTTSYDGCCIAIGADFADWRDFGSQLEGTPDATGVQCRQLQ